ncbi:hypothetical protein NFJ02_21g45210 [Pycnococcus provasolii]
MTLIIATTLSPPASSNLSAGKKRMAMVKTCMSLIFLASAISAAEGTLPCIVASSKYSWRERVNGRRGFAAAAASAVVRASRAMVLAPKRLMRSLRASYYRRLP